MSMLNAISIPEHVVNNLIIAAVNGNKDEITINRHELSEAIDEAKKFSVRTFIVNILFDLYDCDDTAKLKSDFAKVILLTGDKLNVDACFSDSDLGRILFTIWKYGSYAFDNDQNMILNAL